VSDTIIPFLSTGPRRFHVIAKPVGALCNLDCTYCFYLSKEQLLHQPVRPAMSDEMLERFIAQYIAGNAGPEVVFTWQGGEPTLLGIDYFRKIVALQEKHAQPGRKVVNDLQTNGTRLDDEWCEFLKRHDFLVGLSIDGPQELHDRFRTTKGGRPTHAQVMEAARRLQRHGVPFATLTCVNRVNAAYPREIYEFLTQELGSTRVQFIPIVEPRDFKTRSPGLNAQRRFPRIGSDAARPGSSDSIVYDWSVDPDEWGEFLVQVFDQWCARDVGRVLVNWFETMVSVRLGYGAQMCVTNDFCGKNLAIEHDGSVFSCDHYVYQQYHLGNIREHALDALAFSRAQIQFGLGKRESLTDYCKACPYLRDCWGECPKNRLLSTPDGQPGLNYLCSGYRRFYAHAGPIIDRIVSSLPSV
jgi:uncharacterized protein